jgi:hypothetical protein
MSKYDIGLFFSYGVGIIGFVSEAVVIILALIIPLSEPAITISILLSLALMGLGLGGGYLFYERPEQKLAVKSHLEKEEEKENQKKYGTYYKRKSLPICGDQQFTQTVERVLQELKNNAPNRYQEAIGFLPEAWYFDPIHFDYFGLFNRNGSVAGYIKEPFAGRSDGRFSIDGSDYYYFRRVFLHEVGHCVHIVRDDNHSEEVANNYRDQVLRELGG